jgi:hypothetical protein
MQAFVCEGTDNGVETSLRGTKQSSLYRANNANRIPALGRGRASYFFLIKSNQKSSQQKCFFAARGLSPANRAEPRAAKPYLYFVRSISHASARFANALTAAQATIVLPAFARSCSADGEKNSCAQSIIHSITNSIIKPRVRDSSGYRPVANACAV